MNNQNSNIPLGNKNTYATFYFIGLELLSIISFVLACASVRIKWSAYVTSEYYYDYYNGYSYYYESNLPLFPGGYILAFISLFIVSTGLFFISLPIIKYFKKFPKSINPKFIFIFNLFSFIFGLIVVISSLVDKKNPLNVPLARGYKDYSQGSPKEGAILFFISYGISLILSAVCAGLRNKYFISAYSDSVPNTVQNNSEMKHFDNQNYNHFRNDNINYVNEHTFASYLNQYIVNLTYYQNNMNAPQFNNGSPPPTLQLRYTIDQLEFYLNSLKNFQSFFSKSNQTSV